METLGKAIGGLIAGSVMCALLGVGIIAVSVCVGIGLRIAGVA
jgi:hypothetical protein